MKRNEVAGSCGFQSRPVCGLWSWHTVVAGGISSASREATDEHSWDRRKYLPVRGSGSQMKMPSSASLRTAAPLLCNALLVGLVIETRLELSEWHVAAGTGRHRELKDDVLRPSSPYATADDLEDLRVSLEAQLAQQAAVISSVKTDAVELETKLRKRITKDRDALDQFVAAMRSEMAQLKTEPEYPENHRAKPAESRRAAANTTSSARHRKQGGGSCDGASWASRTQAVTDACCPPTTGTGTGHRRAQGRSCSMPATCPSASCAAELYRITRTVAPSFRGTQTSFRWMSSVRFTRAARRCSQDRACYCSRWRCRCSGFV